jgi:predicted Rossmann-fold nucleotide-binding protein
MKAETKPSVALPRPSVVKTTVAAPSPSPAPTVAPAGGTPEASFAKAETREEIWTQFVKDANTYVSALGHQIADGSKVTIIGTARSKSVEGQNGHLDWKMLEQFGALSAQTGLKLGTGAGPGAMEAPLRGHQAYLQKWNKRDRPEDRQGGNIILPNEQGANPAVGDNSAYDRFLFRMEWLFGNATDIVASPGGFGTMAEIFSAMAAQTTGARQDDVMFLAPDNFYTRINSALSPYLTKEERHNLQFCFHDPQAAIAHIKNTKRDAVGAEECPKPAADRMLKDLKAGLEKISSKEPAFSFVGGLGERTAAATAGLSAIASELAKAGAPIRVSGSSADEGITKAARAASRSADITAFRLEKPTLKANENAMPVDDVLVLRDLLTTHSRGLVVTPDGAISLAVMFAAAVDIQTKEMRKIPIVVFDPDNKFDELKKAFSEVMLSDKRKYINPEDLNIFMVTKDPAEAARMLLQGSPAPEPV